MKDVPILYTQSAEFIYQLYLPVMIWLVAVIILMIVLISKYTLGKWTVDNPNPYAKSTLGMPEGVFRGIITMTLLYVVVIFETVNIKDAGFEARANMLLVSFQMMIAFYFGSKVVNQFSSGDGKKSSSTTVDVPQQIPPSSVGTAPTSDPDPTPIPVPATGGDDSNG